MIFPSCKGHPKRPLWRHRWCHRTKFTLRFIPGWIETSTPSLARLDSFWFFYDFLKQHPQKIAKGLWTLKELQIY
jgi:hypothetical protein